jgi:chromosome segregation ATPase
MVNNINDNKFESCPFCKDIAINNLDTAGWNNYTYLKDYHEKIIEKNKIMTKLESRFNELVVQTNFLKKTFFNHLNNSLEIKNKELTALKENYENKLMFLEDLLSQEKIKVEKYLTTNNANNNQVSNVGNLKIVNLEEQIRLKDILISQSENKVRESNKQMEVINLEIKKLLAEKENFEKQNKDLKIRENNLNTDIMLKDVRIENLNNELRNFEKIIEINKKKIEEKEREALNKLKENTEMKNRFDLQVKEINELKKALECLKNNHKEELNDKNRNNQYLINELNNKLDDLTKQLNEKLKLIEEHKLKNQDLISIVEKKNEEIRSLKDNIDRISKSQQEMDILRDKMEQLECYNNNENYKLKKKLEELQNTLCEKEKKIQVKISF